MAMRDIMDYKRVALAINKAKKIALCIHMFPDGDAIGSMLALALALKALKKKFYLFSPSELPHRYNFLPLYGQIKTDIGPNINFDLAIAIDCASHTQLGEFHDKVFKKSEKTIEIDHHAFREAFADISLVDDDAAAVGEIIYHLCELLGVKIGKAIAVPLLVSLIVETGSFRLPTVRDIYSQTTIDLSKNKRRHFPVLHKKQRNICYWNNYISKRRIERKTILFRKKY